jgi:hypothetical protein
LISKLSEPLLDANGKINFDIREGGFDLKLVRNKYFLRGLAIKRDRFFAVSTFINARTILNTIQEFIKKEPARIDDKDVNTWLLNSGVLIRKLDHDTFEASAIGGVVGNGVSMDGGDDLLGMTSDSPSEIMKKITPFPTIGNQKEQFYWIMMTRSHSRDLYTAISWFDAESFQYLKRFNMAMEPEKVDFRDFFFQRLFNVDTKKPINSVDQSAKIIFSKDIEDVIVQVNGSIPFQFSLKRSGKLCHSSPEICTEKFNPIIEVLANDQKTWLIVDIRLMMFYDVATGLKNRFNDSKIQNMTDEEYGTYSDKMMLEEMLTLTLKYRKKQNLNRVLTIEELKSDSVVWINRK